MGVFDLIRAMFGLGGSDNSSTTDVPTEPERRETGGPETSDSDDPDAEPDRVEESAAAGTDATGLDRLDGRNAEFGPRHGRRTRRGRRRRYGTQRHGNAGGGGSRSRGSDAG